MAIVSGTFKTKEAAEAAVAELHQAGFSDYDIWLQEERKVKGEPGEYPDNYDPIGGARLAGTPITSLPASGPNVIGNSVTIDLEDSDFSRLLEVMAEQEDEENNPPGRITLKVDARDRSYEVATILKRNRARQVKVHNR